MVGTPPYPPVSKGGDKRRRGYSCSPLSKGGWGGSSSLLPNAEHRRNSCSPLTKGGWGGAFSTATGSISSIGKRAHSRFSEKSPEMFAIVRHLAVVGWGFTGYKG